MKKRNRFDTINEGLLDKISKFFYPVIWGDEQAPRVIQNKVADYSDDELIDAADDFIREFPLVGIRAIPKNTPRRHQAVAIGKELQARKLVGNVPQEFRESTLHKSESLMKTYEQFSMQEEGIKDSINKFFYDLIWRTGRSDPAMNTPKDIAANVQKLSDQSLLSFAQNAVKQFPQGMKSAPKNNPRYHQIVAIGQELKARGLIDFADPNFGFGDD